MYLHVDRSIFCLCRCLFLFFSHSFPSVSSTGSSDRVTALTAQRTTRESEREKNVSALRQTIYLKMKHGIAMVDEWLVPVSGTSFSMNSIAVLLWVLFIPLYVSRDNEVVTEKSREKNVKRKGKKERTNERVRRRRRQAREREKNDNYNWQYFSDACMAAAIGLAAVADRRRLWLNACEPSTPLSTNASTHVALFSSLV